MFQFHLFEIIVYRNSWKHFTRPVFNNRMFYFKKDNRLRGHLHEFALKYLLQRYSDAVCRSGLNFNPYKE